VSYPTSAERQAPGPSEAFDINVDDTTFEKLAQWRSEFGDIISITPDKRKSPAFLLSHPDHVKQVLIGNHRNYSKGVGFERVAMMLGNGIIVSDGEFWKSQRRMIQPVFHRKVITSQASMMQQCNQRKLVQWQADARHGRVINLTEQMSDEQGGNPFAMLVEDVTRDLKMAMRFRALTKTVAGIMHKRRQQQRIQHDFLSLLMETRDKDSGQPMSDKALIDEVMTLIVAGHETTAGTLNWAWYLLSQNTDVQNRLHREVDALAGPPGIDDLPALGYTKCVLDETLRLYPPVWLYSRKARQSDVLSHVDGDVTLPAGADVFLCPYLMHRDPRYWPSPERFDPERFTEQAIRDRNRHVYYPFSLGSRRCIGEFFSLVDMQLHVGLLAQHIVLRHQPDKPVSIEPHINLRARHSILMRPELRSQ